MNQQINEEKNTIDQGVTYFKSFALLEQPSEFKTQIDEKYKVEYDLAEDSQFLSSAVPGAVSAVVTDTLGAVNVLNPLYLGEGDSEDYGAVDYFSSVFDGAISGKTREGEMFISVDDINANPNLKEWINNTQAIMQGNAIEQMDVFRKANNINSKAEYDEFRDEVFIDGEEGPEFDEFRRLLTQIEKPQPYTYDAEREGIIINQNTLPNTPSEHVITLNPPTTTNYYGGGISWSEGTNTAASLGVYDAGSGGALGFYVATGNNTTLTQALTIDNSQNSTFAGTIASGNIAVTSAGNGEVSVTRTSGASILTQAQSALGRFGTTTNHNLQLMANNSGVLTISTAGNSTFAGSIQSNGTFIELDSASDAQFIIDRASTSDVARLSWRNAGSEFFKAGIETSDNDLWSLLHTCGNGLYFDGTAMAFGFGRDPVTAITLPQGNSTGAKISWYDSTPIFAASIYANSSNCPLYTSDAANKKKRED